MTFSWMRVNDVVWHVDQPNEKQLPTTAEFEAMDEYHRHLPQWGSWRQLTPEEHIERCDSVGQLVTAKLVDLGDIRFCVSYRCGIWETRPHEEITAPPAPEPFGDDQVVIEAAVAGSTIDPLAPRPPCEHKQLGSSVEFHNLEPDDSGKHPGIQMWVRAMCLDCGSPFRFEDYRVGFDDERRTLGAFVEPME